MYRIADKPDRREARPREPHNLRELIEMLLSDQTTTKQWVKMKDGLGWAPPTDVFETDTEFVVVVDIAGMDRRDINVVTDGKILTIQGVRREIAPPGRKHFHKMEIQVGPFQRLVEIPVPVDHRSMFTDYTNGLLEIRMKKRFDDGGRRKIEVE
jgi:HSP20 family molecular chaperone IbpA